MWKKGDKVLIGGKHSGKRHYTSAVGEEATYLDKGDYAHQVVVIHRRGENRVKHHWFIHEEDLLPIQIDNNKEAAQRLLRRE